MKTFGSNTKDPNGGSDSIATSASGTGAEKSAPDTYPAGTLSRKSNTSFGGGSGNASADSPSKRSRVPLPSEIAIDPGKLPPEIHAAISAALGAAHFTSWVPNAATTLVTESRIIELPPGSTIVLVFDDSDPLDLPAGFSTGDHYIVDPE